MDMFVIEGARPLKGSVRISGSKNACLPIITACLLTEEPTILHNVPDLRDVREMRKLIEHLGARTHMEGNTLRIDPFEFRVDQVPYEIMRKMRASFYAMGPMLARLGRAKISLPGGCAIGDRPVDLHLKGFSALGCQMNRNAGYVHARHQGLTGTRISLLGKHGSSVGATCNVMMAAVLAKGTTIIDDAAREPDVVELGRFLSAMGARIEGLGSHSITVHGVERLEGVEWMVMPDRVEAATYAVAGLITHGDIVLEAVNREDMTSSLAALEQWGAELTCFGENRIRIRRRPDAKRPLHLVTEPFPGFPTDFQPQMTALMALTPGESVIRETIYRERFNHVPELVRMGAKIHVESSRATVQGVAALEGAAVMASDLRAGAALVLAGLAAHGTTQVRRIYHIERGYEKFEEKLRGLGAEIRRIPESEVDPGLEIESHLPPSSEPLLSESDSRRVRLEDGGPENPVVPKTA